MCSARRNLCRHRRLRQRRIPRCTCNVDYERRMLIAPNHTLTHVMNWALRRVLQELGVSLPEIHDVDVQRVHVGGRDAYHITFTANGKPYSFYVDAHDGDIF